MRKAILLTAIILFAYAALFPTNGITPGDRKRFFVIGGIGYASSHPEGLLLEMGVELRLFGNIHARVLLEHYFGSNIEKDSEIVKHMNGATLYAVYNMQLSETVEFRLKAGGHFTSIRSQITVIGLTFTSTKANIGYSAGAGFTMQVSNRFYLYAETTVKHLLLDEPWTWVKGQVGVMFRLR